MEISVVVPVYRSQSMIEELHRRLKATLEKIVRENYEIIFVYDCGGDNSWEVITELSHTDEHIRGIKLTKNYGQHAATLCGISKASGRWIVTIDDDLEQMPEDIEKLYDKAITGNHDLIYGVFTDRTHKKWRNMTSTLGRGLFKLAIPSLNYEYTSFRMIKSNIAKALIAFDSPFPFVDGYLSWITHSYSYVNVEHGKRLNGVSSYNFAKLLAHSINIFIAFSDLPLKIASWIGLVSFIVGFFWLLCILSLKIVGGIDVSGYASLMGGIILFGGLQMLILGIFGEYIGRINYKTSKKPLFLISDDTLKEGAFK